MNSPKLTEEQKAEIKEMLKQEKLHASTVVMIDKSKELIIPLDSPLIFIHSKDKRYPTIYQDGKELKGVRSITIKAEWGDITTHTIEFVTGRTDGDKVE